MWVRHLLPPGWREKVQSAELMLRLLLAKVHCLILRISLPEWSSEPRVSNEFDGPI